MGLLLHVRHELLITHRGTFRYMNSCANKLDYRLVVFLVSALSLSACHSAAPLGPYAGAPVIVISIDTLRADHLPAYGYARGSTPELDKLQHDALVFDEVYSHCPLTLPSHASLLTGQLPTHHGIRDNVG